MTDAACSLAARFAAFLIIVQALVSNGATYHVSTSGLDTNPGTELLPWRKIQKAADVAQAGDRIIVHAGTFDERVTTKKAGTADSGRISFETAGQVVMRGWIVSHPFVVVRGFEITGHSAASMLDGYVTVNGGADYFLFESNSVRDGIFYLRTNIAFHNNDPNPDTISCTSGGFLAAGLKPAQSLYIGRGTRVSTPTNSGVYTIQSVADDTITVNGSLTDEPPSPVYLSASLSYGLVVATGAENCVIRSNTFRNLSYDAWFVGGATNLFEHNILEACHGWDAMHFMGTNLTFRGNTIRNSPLVVYQVSPDVFENFASIKYNRIVFERNFVEGFAGVLASQKGSLGDSDSLTFSHNVFVNVGSFSIRYPNTHFLNNTFVNVSAESNPVTSALRHAIVFDAVHTENAILKNNIFVGCGAGRTPDQQGWYEFGNSSIPATRSHNFVSGPAPGFSRKAGYSEGAAVLNGGDPGFVNLADPLGPDGVAFTEDDGLKLRADSKLRAAGDDGLDLGAYLSVPAPRLCVETSTYGPLKLTWTANFDGFRLQRASNANGAWTEVPQLPAVTGTQFSVTMEKSGTREFFRLAK
jgi:hypothetical protein